MGCEFHSRIIATLATTLSRGCKGSGGMTMLKGHIRSRYRECPLGAQIDMDQW